MIKLSGAAALLAGTLLSTPLSAQPGERGDPHLRNNCRLAAQVLRTGHPAPRRAWALDAIRQCETSGPGVLAEVWRSGVPSDTVALGQLFNVTRDFNDRRVVDAVAAVARRVDAPETVRIYAFALLFNYAVPGRYIDTAALLEGSRPGISYLSHDDRAYGTRNLLGDLRAEVTQILAAIAAAEPDSRVGVAAETVRQRIGYF